MTFPDAYRVPRQVLVYLHRGDRFLLLRRTPELGGFWQGVTGAPDPGESDLDAAIREVREETGYLHYPDNRTALERAAALLP